MTRPARSKNEAGKEECRFDVLFAKPNDKQQFVCRGADEVEAESPYKVCDWYLDRGPLQVGTAAAVVVGSGRLSGSDKDVIGDFAFERGEWRLPNNVSGSSDAMLLHEFYGKPALIGTWDFSGYWERRWIKKYHSVYGGTDSEAGVLVQLSPDVRVGILGLSTSDDPLCKEGFCSSLRIASPDEPKAHR